MITEIEEKLIPRRILTANMTGQITLNGMDMDLHFTRGYPRGITECGQVRKNSFRSESYLHTAERKIKFRNESAFAFDSETEYGLRTLQVPGMLGKNRIITDFCFNRDEEDFVCSVFIEYPTLSHSEKILASAPLEIQFNKNVEEIIIKSDTGKKNSFTGFEENHLRIEGKIFNIQIGKLEAQIEFFKNYKENPLTIKNSIELISIVKKRKKQLLLNIGGSYSPLPTEDYSGKKEFFCFRLKIQKWT